MRRRGAASWSRFTNPCRARAPGRSARLRRHLPVTTPVVFGRAVGRDDARVTVTTLQDADAGAADMATLIIVGSAATRVIARPGRAPLVYTPRSATEAGA